MSWLLPAIIGTLAGSVVLALTYSYLYSQEGDRFLGLWTLSWWIYSARFVFLLIMLLGLQRSSLLIANQLCSLWSGYFLLWGTYGFSGRNISRWWLLGAALDTVWIIAAARLQAPFLWLALPTFFFMAVVNIWTGLLFIKLKGIYGLGKHAAGWTFILWGLHKADYPFLQPAAWFAPWGYTLGAILGLLTALTTILVYFEKSRGDLVRSESRFRQVAENIREVFWVVSPDWKMVHYVSPAYEDVWGRSPQSLYENPMSWTELLPEEDLARIKEKIVGLSGTRFPAGSFPDYRVVRADGSVRWVSARYFPIVDHSGQIERVVGIAADITERQLAEEALAKSEQRYRLLAENTLDVIFMTDARLRTTYFSPAVERLLGYTPDEMLRLSPEDYISPPNHRSGARPDQRTARIGSRRRTWRRYRPHLASGIHPQGRRSDLG